MNLGSNLVTPFGVFVSVVVALTFSTYFLNTSQGTNPELAQVDLPAVSNAKTAEQPERGPSKVVSEEKSNDVTRAGGKIEITSPTGGEEFVEGDTYSVRWKNYTGTEDLTIALQHVASREIWILAAKVSAVATSYEWTVQNWVTDRDSYKIQVYPPGGREYVGHSREFKIVNRKFVTITSPRAAARVDSRHPLVITGEARNIRNANQFRVQATYWIGDKEHVISQALVQCGDVQDCDWTSEKPAPFRATLDVSKSPDCVVSIAFYIDSAREGEPLRGQIHSMPLWLYGNSDCK